MRVIGLLWGLDWNCPPVPRGMPDGNRSSSGTVCSICQPHSRAHDACNVWARPRAACTAGSSAHARAVQLGCARGSMWDLSGRCTACSMYPVLRATPSPICAQHADPAPRPARAAQGTRGWHRACIACGICLWHSPIQTGPRASVQGRGSCVPHAAHGVSPEIHGLDHIGQVCLHGPQAGSHPQPVMFDTSDLRHFKNAWLPKSSENKTPLKGCNVVSKKWSTPNY